MSKLYSHFRIFLIMFALGLAAVPFFNRLNERWAEIPVNLPQVKSETPLNVFVLEKPRRELCTIEDENGYCYCSPHSMGVPGGCDKLNEYWRLKDIEDKQNGIF